MANSLNPFEDCNTIDNDISIEETKPDFGGANYITNNTVDLSFDAIAAKLLKENFILTALELHTELLENKRELPKLRDFFLNPSNFERASKFQDFQGTNLHRTNSCQTFDSLDFGGSEEGDHREHDRVAVLEFELRKAQDTIKSLRASLTATAETELSATDSASERALGDSKEEPLRVYEKRAINFLVNEYLLQNNYKFTSVTFAEENENQDFDDWDDVGLNTVKLPGLLQLFRDQGQSSSLSTAQRTLCDAECMTQIGIEQLEQTIHQLEAEKLSLVTRINEMETELSAAKLDSMQQMQRLQQLEHLSKASRFMQVSAFASSGSSSPNRNSTQATTAEESHLTNLSTSQTAVSSEEEAITSFERTESMVTKIVSANNGPTPSPTPTEHGEQVNLWQQNQRRLPIAFQLALMEKAFPVVHDNRILEEMSLVFGSDKHGEKVVEMLGRCLPHIVPNVLLNKREELIPPLICAATLHSQAAKRDELLAMLFNLFKKPDTEQRQMILKGCVAFAQHVGPSRVDAELLPQCWEQITHKYVERRLLVAEACGALAPYVPNEIRSSLVLSILQQLLQDDKDERVREATVRSLGLLMGFVDDADKYNQGLSLLLSCLKDTSDGVQLVANQVFQPSFSMWAWELGKFPAELMQLFVKQLEDLLQVAHSASSTTLLSSYLDLNRFNGIVNILRDFVPLLFASVLSSGPFVSRISEVVISSTLSGFNFLKPNSELCNLEILIGSEEQMHKLVQLYEAFISEEWYQPWETFNWVIGDFLPQLVQMLTQLDVGQVAVIKSFYQFFTFLCSYFGHTFTYSKIVPRFQSVLASQPSVGTTQSTSTQSAYLKCVIPVFAVGVLAVFNQAEDQKQLCSFLSDVLTTLADNQCPLDSIQITISLLSEDALKHDMLLTVLWELVMHSSPLIRAASAKMFEVMVSMVSELLVSSRVMPALITLASDPDMMVRATTVTAFGTVTETVTDRMVLDKVHLQFQTFMDDPVYRDQHNVHMQLVRTLARIGPNVEPRFREEFILPRLAILAAHNNQVTNDVRKMEMALQLFEAYSALSCCFVSSQLIRESLLQGLRCLLHDVQQVAPDHVSVVSSMIRDFEEKLNAGLQSDRSNNNSQRTEESRTSTVFSRILDAKDRASQSKPNFSNFFASKKPH